MNGVATSLTGLLALTGLLLAGCGGASEAGAGDGDGSGAGRRVVTSFYPLQYVAQRVVGDHADVSNLTQPGREPHDLELDFRQTADVADADLVVYERGFQAAVDDAVDQSTPEHVVDVVESADLSGDDPHFWLDPTRLSDVAGAIEKQMVDVDPVHAADYARNLRSLQGDLADLDDAFETGLAHCLVDTIVVSHEAFGYLGRRYGLEVVAINGLSPDAEPSPAHIRELQDLVRRYRITTVFSEELTSPKLADSLADDLGITSSVLDPIEGLSDRTAEKDYLSLMRSNLAALRKADGCS